MQSSGAFSPSARSASSIGARSATQRCRVESSPSGTIHFGDPCFFASSSHVGASAFACSASRYSGISASRSTHSAADSFHSCIDSTRAWGNFFASFAIPLAHVSACFCGSRKSLLIIRIASSRDSGIFCHFGAMISCSASDRASRSSIPPSASATLREIVPFLSSFCVPASSRHTPSNS